MAIQNLTKIFQFCLIHKPVTFIPLLDRSKVRPRYCLTLAAGLIFLFSATAANALDFQSSRTLSLAQSGRGGALLNDTITLNPSLLAFQPVASLSGTFNWLNNSQAPDSNDRAFNVSVIDGKNQYVNAGLSFTRKPGLDFVHAALAKRALEWLSFGASVKRFSTRSNSLAASGQSASGFEAGLSTSVGIPKEWTGGVAVQFGITADNIRHRPQDEQYTGPRQIAAGVKANINSLLMLYGDFVESYSNFKGATPLYTGGAEVSLGGDFYARGGLMGFVEKGWSAGAGWVGPKLGVSYGFQSKRAQAVRDFTHAVTMDIYM